MSHNKVFNQEEVNRLKQLINEGCQVQAEIDSLSEGLTETVKAIAEEMDIPAGALKKAIRVAHKNSIADERDKFDLIETILDITGRNV